MANKITIGRNHRGAWEAKRQDGFSWESSELEFVLKNAASDLDPTIESVEVKRRPGEPEPDIRAGSVLESSPGKRFLVCRDKDGFDLLALSDGNFLDAFEFWLDPQGCVYRSRSEVLDLVRKHGWKLLPGRVEYVENEEPGQSRARDNPMPELRPGMWVEFDSNHRSGAVAYVKEEEGRLLVYKWSEVTRPLRQPGKDFVSTIKEIRNECGQVIWRRSA